MSTKKIIQKSYFIKKYNALSGKVSSRKSLEVFKNEVFNNLPLDSNTHLSYIYKALNNLLKANPKEKEFDINIKRPLTIAGLNGKEQASKKLISDLTNKIISLKVQLTNYDVNSKNYKTLKEKILKLESYLIKNKDGFTINVKRSYVDDILMNGLMATSNSKTRTKSKRKIRKKKNNIPNRIQAKKNIKLKSINEILKEKKVIHEHYKINGPIKEILGNLEIKDKHSIAVTIDAPQGAGKTRFTFQIANEFAKNGYSVLFVSLEEHVRSELFKDKVKQYLVQKAREHFYPISDLENGYNTLVKLIPQFDVVIVDSWNKVSEQDKNLDFDRDLRKKFDGKLFVTIFQRTVAGTMRGGSKAQFDGDVILKIEKGLNFKDNYVVADKNRYQHKEIKDIKYNIFTKKINKLLKTK